MERFQKASRLEQSACVLDVITAVLLLDQTPATTSHPGCHQHRLKDFSQQKKLSSQGFDIWSITIYNQLTK